MPKQTGITFATHNGVALLGDLYTPEGPGPFPAMVVVHGGGWQLGSRATYAGWGHYLAAAGIALFAVDYRLCKKGEKTYPEAVQDVRAAVQHLRGSAADLKIDGKRIGLWGDSAGAQLAALVALAGDHPLFAEGTRGDAFASVSTKVKCCIGLYGVYDMAAWEKYTSQQNNGAGARPLEQFFGGGFEGNEQ